jgi:hypothetical protein
MNLQALIQAVGSVVSSLLAVAMALAVAVFFWGLVVFIFKAGDVKSHEEGKNRMIWGVIALVVMFSVWGIIRFVSQDLGITPSAAMLSPNPCGTAADNSPAPCGGNDQNP